MDERGKLVETLTAHVLCLFSKTSAENLCANPDEVAFSVV